LAGLLSSDEEPKGLLGNLSRQQMMAQALLGYEGMPAPQAEGMPTHDPEFVKRLANALATMPSVQASSQALHSPVMCMQDDSPWGFRQRQRI
jgi:hypothetical protein